jgi:hypothetical protein
MMSTAFFLLRKLSENVIVELIRVAQDRLLLVVVLVAYDDETVNGYYSNVRVGPNWKTIWTIVQYLNDKVSRNEEMYAP